MPRIRQDIATLGADWSDTLIWYARAIKEMQQRKPAKRNSWAYYAAIHGIDRNGWIQAGVIKAGDRLPRAAERAALWNQCQHGGWYFLPWHRGYLAAFEAAVANAVVFLGGPVDWALPYWNYLNAANPLARHIPQALLDPTMPDGSPNPLSAPPRGGTQVLGPQPWLPERHHFGRDGRTSLHRGTRFGGLRRRRYRRLHAFRQSDRRWRRAIRTTSSTS